MGRRAVNPRTKLTTTQAARYVGLSKRQMERLRDNGAGPTWFRAGDSLNSPCMYEVADLDMWVKARKGAR